jgi:hypothetical protein
MLLIWLLYCIKVEKNKALVKVMSTFGPTKIKSALLYGEGNWRWLKEKTLEILP